MPARGPKHDALARTTVAHWENRVAFAKRPVDWSAGEGCEVSNGNTHRVAKGAHVVARRQEAHNRAGADPARRGERPRNPRPPLGKPAGVYAIWHGPTFLYVGMSGRGLTTLHLDQQLAEVTQVGGVGSS